MQRATSIPPKWVLGLGLCLFGSFHFGSCAAQNWLQDYGPAARCGSIINSLDQKNGTIESPRHPRPYPPDITCRFTFQGVGRERVQLQFVHMDLHFPSGDPANPVGCTDSDSVTVYINIDGKEEKLATYCGEKLPPMLMSSGHSSGPAMIVEFQSFRGSSSVTGFRANFQFVTNFGITSGKQDSRGTCVFNYMSHQQSEGHIMSPNYPGLYPRNTECHYLFYGRGKERVDISFLYFEVDGIPPRCEEHTDSDYVSFSNFAETEDRKLYRRCGQSAIGKLQIQSDGAFFRVTFKSNHLYDGHGFHAFYQFFDRNDTKKPRGGNDNSNNNHHPYDNPSNHDPKNGMGVGSSANRVAGSITTTRATATATRMSKTMMMVMTNCAPPPLLLLLFCLLLSFLVPPIFLRDHSYSRQHHHHHPHHRHHHHQHQPKSPQTNHHHRHHPQHQHRRCHDQNNLSSRSCYCCSCPHHRRRRQQIDDDASNAGVAVAAATATTATVTAS